MCLISLYIRNMSRQVTVGMPVLFAFVTTSMTIFHGIIFGWLVLPPITFIELVSVLSVPAVAFTSFLIPLRLLNRGI